jgi:DNA-binding transcriptional regulator GbsR (MarR family)
MYLPGHYEAGRIMNDEILKRIRRERDMATPKKSDNVVNIKEIADEARAELAEERKDAAKRKIKAKLVQLHDAEKIVANFRRELEDLYAEIADGNV